MYTLFSILYILISIIGKQAYIEEDSTSEFSQLTKKCWKDACDHSAVQVCIIGISSIRG